MSGYANEGYAGESGESAGHNNNTKMKAADDAIVRYVGASCHTFKIKHLIHPVCFITDRTPQLLY